MAAKKSVPMSAFLKGWPRGRDQGESEPIRSETADNAEAIRQYLASERIPFSHGYTEYKEGLILNILSDSGLMQRFRNGVALPAGFGSRLDERIVEYPWVFAHLPDDEGLILDAGSTFNKAKLLASAPLAGRRILIYTLETDWITYDPRISYVFGDLRDMLLKDGIAETIVCISTLEHVGFTYDYKNYSKHKPWPFAQPDTYLQAVAEFRRVLVSGGTLLLTVPYGQYEDHGWLQQFDSDRIERVKKHFDGDVKSEAYYRYQDCAWVASSADECAELCYFNIHETGHFEEDGLAAARAVCCLELVKPQASSP